MLRRGLPEPVTQNCRSEDAEAFIADSRVVALRFSALACAGTAAVVSPWHMYLATTGPDGRGRQFSQPREQVTRQTTGAALVVMR